MKRDKKESRGTGRVRRMRQVLHCGAFLAIGAVMLLGRSALAAGSDFNGDGFDDLPIGVPGESITAAGQGAVNVVYGGPIGLTPVGADFIHAGAGPGMVIAPAAFANSRLGTALATGDFNGDGFSDLAMGAPGMTIAGLGGAGAVHVVYGGPGGLTTAGAQIFSQNTAGVADASEGNDNFGAAVAAGDFNNDGIDDLAVGVPYEDLVVGNQGMVHYLFGAPGGAGVGGLKGVGSGVVFPGMAPWFPAVVNANFGYSLAAGDLDANPKDDVIIGAPGDSVAGVAAGRVFLDYNAGSVFVYFGGASLGGPSAAGDRFGHSVGLGNFNGDPWGDIVIGAPYEEVGGIVNAGAAYVAYGNGGMIPVGAQRWHQDVAGIADVAQANDRFGWSVACGDMNGDGFGDVAIGVPYEGMGAAGSAGAVHVLRGSAAGITAAGSQFYYQNGGAPVPAASVAADLFGYRLRVGRFQGGAVDCLAVGVPKKDAAGVGNSGMVDIMYGLGGPWNWLTQPLLGGAANPNDYFGG